MSGPPLCVVTDRAAARNGRAVWNERFFRHCDDAGIPLLVVGDADAIRGTYRHVQYVRCPDLPEIVRRPDGPNGLGPRPFIAFDDPWADAGEREALRAAVSALSRAYAPRLDAPAFLSLDALRDASWRAPIAAGLAAVLDAHGVRRLLVTTQSFLGYAATDLVRARRNLRATYLIHSDYAACFGARLRAALPPGDEGAARPVVRAMYRRMARTSIAPGSAVLFRCHTTEAMFRLFGPDPAAEVGRVLPPGIDVARFAPQPPRRAPSGALRVLVASRLDHDRNHHLLPDIVARAGAAEWHVAGDGSMRAELQALLPRARFHGHLDPDALRRLMFESDTLLHTSPNDTFAEAVIEAMCCALPVVVSNGGGPLCYVTHGHTGLVCSATAEAFAEALRALREDPDLYVYLSRNARFFAERCSWEGLCRAVLDECASSPPRAFRRSAATSWRKTP